MQPNVMQKSWTTSNIVSVVESEARNFADETTMFQSRDLIREYLLKTRVPEILKPQQNRRNSSTFTTSAMTSDMNFAYKHPLVVAEELKNGSGETLANDMDRTLCNVADNSSIIVPKASRSFKKVPHDERRPHLIGKVTPGIARTWEQLSNAMDQSMDSSAEDDDKQSYVLFVRKPFDFQQSDNDHFAVNKIQHEPSEQFYDSIDNDADYADDYDEESCVEGGEMMAEGIDSLEMRCNDVILWSIES